MTSRWKYALHKLQKDDNEIRIISHPLSTQYRPRPYQTAAQQTLLAVDDYQASPFPGTLSPESKWWIVRNNIHKIRSWDGIRQLSLIDERFQDWYLFFQMRRELQRAQQEIAAIQYLPDFSPVHYFRLPVDETHVRIYNVSHVKPNNGIYYASLGKEPIVLQYLLYYFTKECAVPYNSIFRSFLSDLNSVLDTNRQRRHRVVVFQRMALVIAVAVFIILGLMFFSLILGVLTTTSNLRQMYDNDPDGGIEWRQPETHLTTTNQYL